MDEKFKESLKEAERLEKLKEVYDSDDRLKSDDKKFSKESSFLKRLLTPRLWFINTSYDKKKRGKRAVDD